MLLITTFHSSSLHASPFLSSHPSSFPLSFFPSSLLFSISIFLPLTSLSKAQLPEPDARWEYAGPLGLRKCGRSLEHSSLITGGKTKAQLHPCFLMVRAGWKKGGWGARQKEGYLIVLLPPLDKSEIPVLENKILPHKKKTVKIYFCCNVIKGKITLNIRKWLHAFPLYIWNQRSLLLLAYSSQALIFYYE